MQRSGGLLGHDYIALGACEGHDYMALRAVGGKFRVRWLRAFGSGAKGEGRDCEGTWGLWGLGVAFTARGGGFCKEAYSR